MTNVNLKHLPIAINKGVSDVTLTVEECASWCASAGIKYLEGYENQVFQFTLTDKTVDRYNEIVLPKGVQLDKYKKNPVVLAFHDSHTYPVGACIKVWYDKPTDSVKGWVLLQDERTDESGASETCLAMVNAGFLRTGSIGFISIKRHEATAEEILTYGFVEDKWNRGIIHDECELLEFSIVPIPANPSATSEVLTKDFLSKLNDKQKSFLGKTENINLINLDNVSLNKKEGVEVSSKTLQDKKNNVEKKEDGSYINKQMSEIKLTLQVKDLSDKTVLEQIEKFKALADDSTKVIIDIIQAPDVSLSEKAGAKLSGNSMMSIDTAIAHCNNAVTELTLLKGCTNEDSNANKDFIEEDIAELENSLEESFKSIEEAFKKFK